MSFPDCRDKTSFRCSDGMCIPGGLKCNGIQECPDGSDEDELCGELRISNNLIIISFEVIFY